jgi:hypothetical protein
MAQEFLNRANFITGFQQMGGEGMPEGVIRGSLPKAAGRVKRIVPLDEQRIGPS